ncbi:hypothetical protein LCGC14_2507870, partial [marine sediment metagenome]
RSQFLITVNDGKELRKDLDAIPEINVDFQKLRDDIQRLKTLQRLRESLTATDTQISQLPIIPDIDINFDAVRGNIQKLETLQGHQFALKALDAQIAPLAAVDLDIEIIKRN